MSTRPGELSRRPRRREKQRERCSQEGPSGPRAVGEAHDNRLVHTLLSGLKSGAILLVDCGYDADWIRALANQHGAWANIPPKRNRNEAICFSPHLYRARNLFERFFNKIKQCRRIATRYDKLAANYLALVKLASIRPWRRLYESAQLKRIPLILNIPHERSSSRIRLPRGEA
jgi:transposase